MSDSNKDFSYEGAHHANKIYGDTPEGRRLLSDQELGKLVLDQAEESEFHRENSYRDPLTNLLNRRGLFAESANTKATLEREKNFTGFSVRVMDMIGLKRLNTERGEKIADQILQRSTALILNDSRKGIDVVCRYGGDEVVIVSFNTDSQTTRSLIERTLKDQDPDVRYNVGFKFFQPDEDIHNAVEECVNQIGQIKKARPVDETGRSTGQGVVVELN